MTMTETRPEEVAAAAPAPPPAPEVLAQPAGLAGWLTTTDHKRIGLLYVVTGLLFLVGMLVLTGIVGIEQADPATGTVVAPVGGVGQVASLAVIGLVLAAAAPIWLGLATYLVPLQVGAHSLAYPRAAAAGYWGYLISASLLLASYGMNGGPGGGDPDGVELFLVALGLLVVSLLLGSICVATTALTMRVAGMDLRQVPFQTWSALVGAVMLLVTLPVLAAELVLLYLDHHYGQVFLGGADGILGYLGWVFLQPQVLLFALPAIGVVADVVPVFAGQRQKNPGVILVAIGALGVLGFGAYLQTGLVPDVRTQPLAIAMTVAAVVPVLVLLALWARTLAAGVASVRLTPTLLFALTTAAFLLVAVVCGAITVVDPFDLRGTTWDTAVLYAFVVGVGVTGAFTALHFWVPKMFGKKLSVAAAGAQWFAVLLGGLLLVVPSLITGGLGQPAGAVDYQRESASTFLNSLTVAGVVLLLVALAVLLIDLFRTVADPASPAAGADPWSGHTLEWATSSPPPLDDFDGPLPAITSDRPVLDAREAEAAR